MKITLCSSALFSRETYKIKKELEKLGHEVFIYPEKIEVDKQKISIEKFYKLRKNNLSENLLEVKRILMREHFKKIEKSDAILVLNLDKECIESYIGGNTFLEMGIAFYLKKKIYLWKNPSKELPYYEEIMAMKPVVINENLEKIK